MTGLVRDARTVEVDDATLTAIHAAGGKVLVLERGGSYTAGELVHDGTSFVIRLEADLDRSGGRVVKIKPRLALARGAS